MGYTKETPQRIVEAAVRLFSYNGFNLTSTREIARLAGVHEVTVFRYFPRKQDLFLAAIQSRLERLRLHKDLQRGLSENQPPEIVIPHIIEFLVETAAYNPELIKLLRFGLMEFRVDAEQIYRTQLGPLFRSLVTYLEHCVSRGSARDVDPSMAAVAFVTTILSHQGLCQLFTGNAKSFANTEQMIAAHTKFWLTLVLPDGAGKSIRAMSASFSRA